MRLGVCGLLAAVALVGAPAAADAAGGPVYSTYLGGSADETGLGTFVDGQGNFYVTGWTKSTNYPVTAGAAQPLYGGGQDAFVAKYGPSGSLVYSTYLGGSGLDEGRGIAADSAGNVYVTGFTQSTNFPTSHAQSPSLKGAKDGFLTKLSPQGSTVFSTYLGGAGSDSALALALDASRVYLTGETDSVDFPVTPGAFDTSENGNVDAYVASLDLAGALVYATFLGSPGFDDGLAIAVDGGGQVHVTGKASAGFPVTAGAYDSTQNGGYDIYVSRLNAAGSALGYSTYVGGSNWDEGLGIAVDAAGSAYVTGNVQSPNYPTTPGAYKTAFTGSIDASVTKLSPDGSALVYSTLLGGSSWTEGDGLAVDSNGNAYVTGHLGSSDYPTTADAVQPRFGGVVDGFVTKLDAVGSRLLYSSYYGGSNWDGAFAFSVDAAGNAYVTGGTASTDYPVTSGAPQPALAGGYDAMVAKIATTAAAAAPPVATSPPVASGVAEQGQTLSTTNGSWDNSPSSYGYQWQRCDSAGANCSNIAGATASSYLLTGADVNFKIRALVTATNSAGSATAASNQVGPVAGVLTVTVSAGGDDGEADASGPGQKYPPTSVSTSTSGGSLTAARRSVSKRYSVFVPLLRFDTSALPDNATVTSATLKVRVNARASDDNRNLVAEWYPASNWPIDASDYALNSSANALAGAGIRSIPTATVAAFTLLGPSNISKIGYTGLRLHVDGGAPGGDNFVEFAAFENGSGYQKPQLVVRYTLP